jgi:hypothetical protein
LKPIQAKANFCDGCMVGIPKDAMMFSCKECNYDQCITCVSQSQTLAKLKKETAEEVRRVEAISSKEGAAVSS